MYGTESNAYPIVQFNIVPTSHTLLGTGIGIGVLDDSMNPCDDLVESLDTGPLIHSVLGKLAMYARYNRVVRDIRHRHYLRPARLRIGRCVSIGCNTFYNRYCPYAVSLLTSANLAEV